MRGEELDEAFVGYSGIYGDRVFAFTSSASPKGFPYFTAREQRQMLRYQPRFRNPEKAAHPINMVEAKTLSPNIEPVYADADDMIVDVKTPAGDTVAIDDPLLMELLRADTGGKHDLVLMRSDRALTDCRPVSIFALQSAEQLGQETGLSVDKRRFRANIYLDSKGAPGFAENGFLGRSFRIGARVVVAIVERDARCMIITLDPDTAEKTPSLLKQVAQAHEGMAGLYGAVLVEGMIRKGDPVELLE